MPTGDGKIHIDRNTAYSTSASDDEFICYAWRAVAGVSAFGTYTGATDGSQRVYTTSNGASGGTGGFRPRLIITKTYDTSSSYGSWTMIDAFRANFGTSGETAIAKSATLPLYANESTLEGKRGSSGSTTASEVAVSIYDDGFKFTGTDDPESNGTGYEYIYMAFA
jgi:hypothetical protein